MQLLPHEAIADRLIAKANLIESLLPSEGDRVEQLLSKSPCQSIRSEFARAGRAGWAQQGHAGIARYREAAIEGRRSALGAADRYPILVADLTSFAELRIRALGLYARSGVHLEIVGYIKLNSKFSV